MLSTLDHIIDIADSMVNPAAYADVREGSGKAKFYLVDTADGAAVAQRHELSRSAFNAARSKGHLYQQADDPLMVGEHQAWKVRTELDDG